MSDQSLREALESVAGFMASGKVTYLDEQFVQDLLALHPSEPAPVVTDDAVQDLHERVVTEFRRHGQYTLADARAALEAAVPLLGPRPLLDREAVRRVFVDAINAYVLGGTPTYYGYIDAVMGLARPMPTQAELADWLHETFTADTIGPTWDLAAECLLIALNGAES